VTGFTLVELLTVIAIIGVLTTLLLSAVSSARKSSWRARCTSNLRQISLALNMYLDDFEKRPPSFDALVETRYLPDKRTLLCPADKTHRWGNLVSGSLITARPPTFDSKAAGGVADADVPEEPLTYSYLHVLNWDDDSWRRLQQVGGSAGWVSCQLHGLGRPDPDSPSIHDYQGMVLRGQRDGAVVVRRVFRSDAVTGVVPNSMTTDNRTAVSFGTEAGPTDSFASSSLPPDPPWEFFADEPN
jgi:prepilin-type N-terminal cleavage/methylation domain-containing protein